MIIPQLSQASWFRAPGAFFLSITSPMKSCFRLAQRVLVEPPTKEPVGNHSGVSTPFSAHCEACMRPCPPDALPIMGKVPHVKLDGIQSVFPCFSSLATQKDNLSRVLPVVILSEKKHTQGKTAISRLDGKWSVRFFFSALCEEECLHLRGPQLLGHSLGSGEWQGVKGTGLEQLPVEASKDLAFQKN